MSYSIISSKSDSSSALLQSTQTDLTGLYEIPTGEKLDIPQKCILISDYSTDDAFVVTITEDIARLLEILDVYMPMPSEEGAPPPPKSPGTDVFHVYEISNNRAIQIDYYTNTDMQGNEAYYLNVEEIKERAKSVYYYWFEALDTNEIEMSLDLINGQYSQAAFSMQSNLAVDTPSHIIVLSSVKLNDDDRKAFAQMYELEYE